MFSVTVIVCAYPARKLHNLHIQSPTPCFSVQNDLSPSPSRRHTHTAIPTGNDYRRKCRPRVPGGTHGQRDGAETSPKGAGRHSRATERGRNVAQRCRAALTGNRKGLKRRPRVQGGTHRQQKGAEMSPKGAGRHSRATGWGGNVAQGCRTVLTGNRNGHKCRPRVPGGTHGQREGAEMSPKGAGRHSRATGWGINVAQGCRTVLTGYGKGRKRRPRVPGGTHGQREGT